jgi:hypothetical protein
MCGPAARMRGAVVAVVLAVVASAGPAAATYAERVHETTLANGLKLILLEDHKAPVVVFQLYYRVGSRNEQLGHTGLSHILEHVMFKGTDKVAPEDYSKIIQRNGGRTNAWTTSDATTYFATLASDRVGVVIDLEADRMTNLKLTDAIFLPERDVIMEERRLRLDSNPVSNLFEQLLSTSFEAHPYEFPVIGWMNDIAQATLADALQHYRTYYIPNNAFVVAVGDFDSAALTEQISAAFGPISRGDTPPPVLAVEPPQHGTRRAELKRKRSCRRRHGPSRAQPAQRRCRGAGGARRDAVGRRKRSPAPGARVSPPPGSRGRRQLRLYVARSQLVHRVRAAAARPVCRRRRERARSRDRAGPDDATDATRAREGEERHGSAVRVRPGLSLLSGDAARSVRGGR